MVYLTYRKDCFLMAFCVINSYGMTLPLGSDKKFHHIKRLRISTSFAEYVYTDIDASIKYNVF